jgi:hypothetical protein
MLFPPFGVRASNPLGAVAPYHEVTGIFTTALPMRHHIDNWKARWGTGDIGVCDVCADSCFRKNRRPGRQRPLQGRFHDACITGGIRTRSFRGAKYPKSSPPASVEPREAANQFKNSVAALRTARRH